MKKLLIIYLIVLFFSSPAYAYLDPGTGNAIIAAIIGVFAAIIWNIKKIWFKFIKILKKNKSK